MPACFDSERVRHAYDEVASAYATTFGDELDQLPLDAELIDRIAADADSQRLYLLARAN